MVVDRGREIGVVSHPVLIGRRFVVFDHLIIKHKHNHGIASDKKKTFAFASLNKGVLVDTILARSIIPNHALW